MSHIVKCLANVDNGSGAEVRVVEVLVDFVHWSVCLFYGAMFGPKDELMIRY